MMTHEDLIEKLDSGIVFSNPEDIDQVKWYPLSHLKLITDYYQLEGDLMDVCESIISYYNEGVRLGGLIPEHVQELAKMHHYKSSTFEQHSLRIQKLFPSNLLQLNLKEINDLAAGIIFFQTSFVF